MPRLTDRPTTRITVRIFTDTHEELKRMATPDLEYNALIRQILHQYVVHARDLARRKIDAGIDAGAGALP